jgi:adenylate cyclase
VFFNDPVPCDDAPLRAIRMALAMRDRVQGLAESWTRRGFDLSLGIGLAQGYATLGRIGFEGRFDYAAIGSVTNLAARLCSDAEPWEVLAQQRVVAEAGDAVVSVELGSRDLRGFSRPIRTCRVRGLDSARVPS